MRFRDLPQYQTWGNWHCDFGWKNIEPLLKDWEDNYGLDMNPDFQRAHVWDQEKQIKYIEHNLKKGKSGKDILFNSYSWNSCSTPIIPFGDMVIVDGKQRVEAVRAFLRDDFKVFGYKYSEFEGPLSNMISFKFHVNDLPTKKDVLEWYLQINEGQVAHTEEELNKVREMLKAG